MSNVIQGIKVGSTTYKYDYNSLENLPAPELPSSTQNDSGKTLTVNSSGDPAWKTPASGLPSSTAGDNGKVLAVNSMGNPAWATPQPELPSYSQNDSGKALFVNTTGHLTWSPAEGALPVIGANDEGKVLIVNDNSAEWGEVIPAPYASDEGKALVVNSSGEPVWRDILPAHDTSYDGSDAGKALIVATNGELKWDEAGGGGSLPDTDGASNGDVLIVSANDNSVYWGSPFPSYDTTSDVGKVLTITENGPEWVMPS